MKPLFSVFLALVLATLSLEIRLGENSSAGNLNVSASENTEQLEKEEAVFTNEAIISENESLIIEDITDLIPSSETNIVLPTIEEATPENLNESPETTNNEPTTTIDANSEEIEIDEAPVTVSVENASSLNDINTENEYPSTVEEILTIEEKHLFWVTVNLISLQALPQ